MSSPEYIPEYSQLSESQAKLLNAEYLRKEVKDEFIKTLAADFAGKGPETPSSLPLFYEFLREGRSKEQVLALLIQYYSDTVTQEHNASLAYRFYRAQKRPDPEPEKKPQRKRRKRT